MVRPRVFVSSVVDGFNAQREAARNAIEAAGAEPVLVNEDFPSLAVSSRNACLDAIDSCDGVVLVVGERGGWVTPSGRLVVEEEYHHARSRGFPVLVFLENADRDEVAARFVAELSHYVDGQFRTVYRSLPELAQFVERGVRELMQALELPMADLTRIQSIAEQEPAISGEASVRLVVAPERDEEVVDPIRIQSKDFRDLIYRVGHDPCVALLNYERPKALAIEGGSIVVTQTDEGRRVETVDEVVLKVGEAGTVVVDTNVTGWVNRDTESYGMLDSHVIAYEDVMARLEQSVRFVAAVFDEVDPYKRHVRFAYQVTIMNVGFRTLEKDPKPRDSYTIRHAFREDRPIPILDDPRIVTRGVLGAPEGEIQRVMALLERHLGD